MGPSNDPSSPLILVPVTAEDAARRTRRIRAGLGIGAALVIIVAAVIYKRSVDPIHAQESYDAGVRLLKIARYNQAILSFDRAVALRADFADAYLLRGKAYVGEAKTDRAIRDFSKVIELRPNDPNALLERGSAYLELKDFQRAIEDSNRALALDPKLGAALNLRGVAIRTMGDPRKALEDFKRAVELAPSEDNYYQRGATYQMIGEHRLAIADFDRVIEFKPDEAPGYFARAESRRAIGDERGAKADHLRGRILDGR